MVMSSAAGVSRTDRLNQSSEPERLWSRSGTASEIHPAILSPLCWSFWEEALESANREVFVAMGILPVSDLENIPEDVNEHAAGCFSGRLAVNVDRMRDLLGMLPGVSADDFERDFLGSVRPGLPKQRTAYARLPVMAVKLPRVIRTVSAELERVHDDTHAWWVQSVLEEQPAEGVDWVARIEEARDRFRAAISVHIRSRFLVQIAQSALGKLATAAGDPRLANDVVSGLGGTVETVVAEDLWKLSRGQLSEADFMRAHGYHGPYESHLLTYSWRERPDRVASMAAAYSRRDDVGLPQGDPTLEATHTGAAEKLLAATTGVKRRIARRLIAWARALFRNVQLGRSGYVMCVDAGRRAARALGSELVAGGALTEVDDVFFLSVEELRQLSQGGLPDARDTVARRREERKVFASTTLPVSFIGNPTPIVAEPETGEAAATQLQGKGICGGRLTGRARVLVDLDEDLDLDDGDILVCRNTDPSWTSIMSLASGLVVDLGGSASHAAIVAREMGLACVVGTGNGTALIPDRAVIEIDGGSGTVTILEAAPSDAPAATSS